MLPRHREVIRKAVRIAEPIFHREGWVYGVDMFPPTKTQLYDAITGLLAEFLDPDTRSVESGRFRIVRDPEVPSDFDIYLHLGTIS